MLYVLNTLTLHALASAEHQEYENIQGKKMYIYILAVIYFRQDQ